AAGAHRARRGDGLLVQHHPRDHPLSGPESLPVQAAHPRRGGGDRDGRLLPPPAPPARAALALAAGRRGGPAPGGGGDRAGGKGAMRWLDVGLFSIQPTDLARLAAVVFLAWWLKRRPPAELGFARGLLPPLLMVAGPSGLILLQPKPSTAVLLALSGGGAMSLS